MQQVGAFGPVGEAVQRHAAEQHPPAANLRLPQKGTAAKPGHAVQHPHNRAHAGGQRQRAALRRRPPLPVCMEFCREIGQRRVGRVDQQPHRAGLRREGADRPEIGAERAGQRTRQRGVGVKQRPPAGCNPAKILLAEPGQHPHAGRRGFGRGVRVAPERVGVGGAARAQAQRQPVGAAVVGQAAGDRPGPAQPARGKRAGQFPAIQRAAGRVVIQQPVQRADRRAAVVGQFQVSRKHIAGRKGVAVKPRQRQHRCKEGFEPRRRRKGIGFGLGQRIHHADQRGALAGKILQPQQRKPAHRRGAQRGFDLLFVAEQRKLAARGDAGRPAGAGPGLRRAAADHGQVVRQRYPVVACKLGKIRPDLVLADLKPKDGLPAAPGFGGLCIVAAGSGEFMVQMADQRRACRPQHRAAVGHGGEKVARRVGALLAVGIVGGGGIQPGRVGPAGCAEQPVHRGAAGFAVAKFVAKAEHHKARVVRVGPKNLAEFPRIVRLSRRIFERMAEVPVGQFGLQQHPGLVGGRKGGFGRAPGVKTHAVDAVGRVPAQQRGPGGLVHRRVAGARENAAVGFPAQKDRPAVERKPPALHAEIPQAEPCFGLVGRGGGTGQEERGRKGRELRVEFIPARRAGADSQTAEPERCHGAGGCGRAGDERIGQAAGRRGEGRACKFDESPCQRGGGGGDINRDVEGIPARVDPHGQDAGGRPPHNPQRAEDAVPVGLGFVGGGRSIGDRPGRPAGVGVVAYKGQGHGTAGPGGQLKDGGGAQAGGNQGGQRRAVHFGRKLPRALHLPKQPSARGRRQRNGAHPAGRAGIGVAAGQPAGLRRFRRAKAGCVQRAGQRHLGPDAAGRQLPGAGQGKRIGGGKHGKTHLSWHDLDDFTIAQATGRGKGKI